MARISIVAANLASLSLESLLYGAFALLFAASTYLFAYRAMLGPSPGVRSMFKRPLFAASLVLFVCITSYWILTVLRSIHAFSDSTPRIAATYFSDLRAVTEVSKVALLTASLMVGDLVLVYRLWIISGKSKRTLVFPLLSFSGSIASSIAGMRSMVRAVVEGDVLDGGVFVTDIAAPTTVFCILTLLTNVLCAATIAWFLWRTHTRVEPKVYRSFDLMRVLSTCIESAALYVIWAAFYLAVYIARSDLQYIVLDCWCPIAGIAFMLINVRVSLAFIREVEQSTTHYAPTVVFAPSGDLSMSFLGSHTGSEIVPQTSSVPHDLALVTTPVAAFQAEAEAGTRKSTDLP